MRLSSCLIALRYVLGWLVLSAYCCSGQNKDLQYLYENATEKHFVREVTGKSDERPDFLYSPDYPNSRIITYYAHWCPHCIHFKPRYIQLSNKIHEMSERFHVTVETFAVSCVPHAMICRDHGIHGYPSVVFYPPHSLNGTKLQYMDLHPQEIFQMAEESRVMKAGNEHRGIPAARSSGRKGEVLDNLPHKPHFMHRTKSEVFHDAHLSFDFAMKMSVFTQSGPLPEKPRKALREFLIAMKKTIPVNSSMQPVVRDLLNNFESIVTNVASLNQIMAKHPPPNHINKWSPASLQHGTGYTAGMWILFHIMSVGLVQWNHFAMDDGQKLIPAAMADIQRNYVENFFQCEECRLNFLSEYDACMYDRCNRLATTAEDRTTKEFIQYPLWLYETHNGVNVRLRQERIEQGIEKETLTTQAEVSWPSTSSCSSCWLSGDKGRWDELEIYKFLQKSYWPEGYKSELVGALETSEVESNSKNPTEVNHMEVVFHSTGPWCCLTFMGIFLWYRKRRYIRKGMHKKLESDSF